MSMSPRKKSAASILRRARRKKGLTQIEVAEKAKLGKNTYPKIERGENQPSPSSIKKLIKVLDIEPSDVVDLL